VFAIAIAFVTDPLVRAAQRRLGTPRWIVAGLVYAGLLLLFAAALYAIGTNALHDLMRMAERGPATIRNFISQAVGPDGIVEGDRSPHRKTA